MERSERVARISPKPPREIERRFRLSDRRFVARCGKRARRVNPAPILRRVKDRGHGDARPVIVASEGRPGLFLVRSVEFLRAGPRPFVPYARGRAIADHASLGREARNPTFSQALSRSTAGIAFSADRSRASPISDQGSVYRLNVRKDCDRSASLAVLSPLGRIRTALAGHFASRRPALGRRRAVQGPKGGYPIPRAVQEPSRRDGELFRFRSTRKSCRSGECSAAR